MCTFQIFFDIDIPSYIIKHTYIINIIIVCLQFQAPLVLVVLIILISIFLTFAPIVTEPDAKYLIAILFVVLAFICYVIFVYKQYRPKWMGKLPDMHFTAGSTKLLYVLGRFTYVMQLLFESVPSQVDQEKTVQSNSENQKQK